MLQSLQYNIAAPDSSTPTDENHGTFSGKMKKQPIKQAVVERVNIFFLSFLPLTTKDIV
jgi:hypothetical protein